MWHTGDGQLMEYLDGELSWIARWRVRRHLRVCWQCRAGADQMRALVGDFMRYRSNILIPSQPAPPRPWAQLPFAAALPDSPAGWAGSVVPHAWRPLWMVTLLATGLAAAAYLGVAVLKKKRPDPAPSLAPGAPRTAISDRRRIDSPALVEATPPAGPPRAAAGAKPGRDEELRIIAVLHSIGADLGEAIELRAVGGASGGWTVSATGLSRERERELREALPPGVRVATEQPRPDVTAPAARESAPAADSGAALPDRLASRLGGPVAFERIANAILEESDAMMARAYALRNLGRRFPAGEPGLTPGSLAKLDQIRADHHRALGAHVQKLQELTGPLREAIEAPRVRSNAPPPADLTGAAQRVDLILNMLLAGARPDKAVPELASELAELLARLGNGTAP